MSESESPNDRQTGIDRLQNGDADAYQALWNTYGERLRSLAQSRLPRELQQRVAPEDVVQSACRTFFRRMQGGQLQLDDAENLWHLLCAITINKVRMQARFHGRQRRNVRREARFEPNTADGEDRNLDPPGNLPLPDDLAEYADVLQQLLASLDEEERTLVQCKLEDRTNDEIAEHLECSERTVRRIMARVREKLKQQLVSSWGNDT